MTHLFCRIPRFDGAKIVVGTCGELEVELEAKQPIYVLHEIEQGVNLLFNLHRVKLSTNQNLSAHHESMTYLRGHAEYVGVILYESSDTSQASKGTAGFIPVDDTEFSHSDRELLVTSISRVKDQAVTRTVHRLQRPFLLLNVENEHVVLVVLPVTRGFPEFRVVHVGRDD
jgi:hypothetical protein